MENQEMTVRREKGEDIVTKLRQVEVLWRQGKLVLSYPPKIEPYIDANWKGWKGL